MDRFRTRLIAALGVAVLLFTSFTLGVLAGSRRGQTAGLPSSRGGQSARALIGEALEKILSASTDPPSEEELARGAIRGMIRLLQRKGDSYALFYTPGGYRSFQELTTGRFSGIGVWLKQNGGGLVIVSVLPKSPALGAGLKRGDVVRTVGGESVSEMTVDEAVARIKGPAGTEITVGIEREGKLLSFTVDRESLDLPKVEVRVPRGNLGHIRLLSFARGAGETVRKKIERLTERGVDGVVLDLRDNGGGLFSEAVDVASVFIEDGDIVTYRARKSDDVVYRARGDAFEDLPLVVLVNEGTASASEVVAAALQDEGRALVVGTETYGKGSVQEVVPLLDSSALKLTTGSYISPEGRRLDGDGIQPDVQVASRRPREQIRRAIEILQGIVISTTGAQG